jgi:5-methyltetrahydrofolate--homocysteine methyltransferase
VRPIAPIAEARSRRVQLEWFPRDLAKPRFTGVRHETLPSLAPLVDYLDWTFFFTAWDLRGRYPQILEHPDHGAAARELLADGQAMLQRLLDEGSLEARAAWGFWPAFSENDDLVLGSDRGTVRFPMLRQQQERDDSGFLSLADFVAPRGAGLADHLGAFAVGIFGAEELAERFREESDDYSAILVKALADRFAEAYAEYLHERARRAWGFGDDENLTKADLLAERYRGIRPAFGYPACPDHSRKYPLFDLLDAQRVGFGLTSSAAVTPAAAVSGLIFAHPRCRYFTIGKVGRDQVEDYARRTGLSLEEAEGWLGPNLGYDRRSGA